MNQARFDESAAYEQFMGRWSRALAPQFVRFAGVAGGDIVLDVGSGTGALSFAIAEAAPSTQVIGVDPSAAYVAAASARTSNPRLRFVVGDAQQLDLPDRSFDRVVSLLVVNFIPDRDRALGEMIRVTRPGGVVAAAVWDYDEGMEMLRVFWDEAVALNPAAAGRDERNMPLCRRGQLAAFWKAHGLQEVDERALSIPLRFASFDDYWQPFLGGQGPAGAYVVSLAAPDRETLREQLRRRFVKDGADRPFTLQARAWSVRGRVAQP